MIFYFCTFVVHLALVLAPFSCPGWQLPPSDTSFQARLHPIVSCISFCYAALLLSCSHLLLGLWMGRKPLTARQLSLNGYIRATCFQLFVLILCRLLRVSLHASLLAFLAILRTSLTALPGFSCLKSTKGPLYFHFLPSFPSTYYAHCVLLLTNCNCDYSQVFSSNYFIIQSLAYFNHQH